MRFVYRVRVDIEFGKDAVSGWNMLASVMSK